MTEIQSDEAQETSEKEAKPEWLAATSLMMTDLDELVSLLNVPLPDWDEIRKNQPGGSDLAEAIG